MKIQQNVQLTQESVCLPPLTRLLQVQFVKGPGTAQLLHEHASVLRSGDGFLPVGDAVNGSPAQPIAQRQSPAQLGGQHRLPRSHRRH